MSFEAFKHYPKMSTNQLSDVLFVRRKKPQRNSFITDYDHLFRCCHCNLSESIRDIRNPRTIDFVGGQITVCQSRLTLVMKIVIT